MTVCCDCLVLGVGGFGSAALRHAAVRGLSAVGIEQFSIAHDRGSSHGRTRIIRKAYFEHPDYVPLLMRAYEMWRALESEQRTPLMRLCGLTLAGPPGGEAVAGARLAARIHGVPLRDVPHNERATTRVGPRLAGFRFSDAFDVVHEPEAGYLDVEQCVRAHARSAVGAGARIVTGETVIEWRPAGGGVRVSTDKTNYEAARLIVTAGPWSARLLGDVGLPLEVVRKLQFWFPTRSETYSVDLGAPAFYVEMPYGHFYGFPSIDGRTIKVAEHTGGAAIDDPDRLDRSVAPDDLEGVSRFVRACLPDVDPRPASHSACMYTLTPDRHFVVDRHPRIPQVAFGAGFSGHGFKFTPVIGEALVDLATEGRTRHPIGFLAANRAALSGRGKTIDAPTG